MSIDSPLDTQMMVCVEFKRLPEAFGCSRRGQSELQAMVSAWRIAWQEMVAFMDLLLKCTATQMTLLDVREQTIKS